jgi:hypothetical protein
VDVAEGLLRNYSRSTMALISCLRRGVSISGSEGWRVEDSSLLGEAWKTPWAADRHGLLSLIQKQCIPSLLTPWLQIFSVLASVSIRI